MLDAGYVCVPVPSLEGLLDFRIAEESVRALFTGPLLLYLDTLHWVGAPVTWPRDSMFHGFQHHQRSVHDVGDVVNVMYVFWFASARQASEVVLRIQLF